jgi:hypothetical protein
MREAQEHLKAEVAQRNQHPAAQTHFMVAEKAERAGLPVAAVVVIMVEAAAAILLAHPVEAAAALASLRMERLMEQQ